jgi:hypothetical protein
MVCGWLTKLGAMDRNVRVERVLRCRKCYRTGAASWDVAPTGARVLLALSDGFHRRARFPLNLPPEIVCDCGTAQLDHD